MRIRGVTMRVKNINGINADKCECGSWLEHWKEFSGNVLFPRYCPVMKCSSRIEVGAHVQIEGASDKGWYIVPLCKEHGAETGSSLEISNMVDLVSASIGDTCGK